MANSVIEQQPLYENMPVGQEIIFVVSNATAVASESKVKFIARVHISEDFIPNVNTTTHLVGTFKTTPNNAGVGVFDFRSILENYVKADNMAATGSSYKGTATTVDERHPLHLVDKYSTSNNGFRWFGVQFAVEYLGATDTAGNQDDTVVREQDGTQENSIAFSIFNGYLNYEDVLTKDPVNANFGYDLSTLELGSSSKTFLTNAPTTQYANLEDYGTFSFLQNSGSLSAKVNDIRITYYKNDGTTTSDTITKDTANGAYPINPTFWIGDANLMILYIGVFPGNLQNWSSTFQGLVAAGTIQGGYYTVETRDSTPAVSSKTYRINVNCPDGKGYESIRLCWLNKWGAWDYYTFTKKSVKSLSTQGTTYQQLGGTWNESVYRTDGYKGGKTSFRVNTTERIRVNTDFVSESYNVMFEELINSPEVYLLSGYQTDSSNSLLNQYVTPVRLTTSSFTRKTIANDKLLQYTFEIEKSKTLRTQSV